MVIGSLWTHGGALCSQMGFVPVSRGGRVKRKVLADVCAWLMSQSVKKLISKIHESHLSVFFFLEVMPVKVNY